MLSWALLMMLAAAPEGWLSLKDCAELDESALRTLAELELSRPIGASTAVVQCDLHAFVVTVRTAEAGRQQRRVVRAAVGDVPERYLAVELAELVEISQDVSPEAESEPPPTSAVEPAPEQPPPAPTEGWLVAGPRVEVGGRPAAWSGGASVALGGRLGRWIALRAELLGMGGAARVDEGSVRLGLIGGSAAAMITVDAGPTVLHAGLGARLGEVFLRGVPRQGGLAGGRHRGTTWSPLISAGVLGPRRGRGRLSGQIEVGWTVRPVRGLRGDALVFSAGGPWLGVSLGGGIRLGR